MSGIVDMVVLGSAGVEPFATGLGFKRPARPVAGPVITLRFVVTTFLLFQIVGLSIAFAIGAYFAR